MWKDDLFYKGKKQFFIKPVSNVFGFDRGTPIDRYYIENFLNINLNDNSLEGMRHTEFPAFSVQYHPEHAPGPHEAMYLFDRFIDLMEERC